MTTPENIPEDMRDLFVKYLDGSIEKDDQVKLFNWITAMKREPAFNLMDLLVNGFGGNRRQYDALTRAVLRQEKRLEVGAGQKLKELEAGDFAQFIEGLWQEAKGIATTTIMAWFERAREYGYYDPESGKVKMKEFIEDACNFYAQNRENLEILVEQLNDTEATLKVFAELARPNFLRLTALRSYTQFMSQVITLGAKGIPVPEAIIYDVKETVNRVILSAGQIAEEAKVDGK